MRSGWSRKSSTGHDQRTIPIIEVGQPINVSFRLDIYQLLEVSIFLSRILVIQVALAQVNEPKQYVTINAWIIESWQDNFLVWEPKLYDGISAINLPHSAIWLPDTILYNSLTMKVTPPTSSHLPLQQPLR